MRSDDPGPLPRLDLNRLLTFLAIAEAGGASAAARRLFVTRSAVSHSLGALEAELGVALFHRVGKRLVPTPEGRRLRRAVAEARDGLGAALEELLGAGGELRGPVRIGVFVGFSRFRLAGAIDAFVREHPRARVRVAFGPQAWLVEELLAAKLDLALTLRPTREQTPHLRSQKLFEQTLVLAVRELPRRGPLDFAALCGLPIVDYYQSDPLIDRWTRHHHGGKRVPRERLRVFAGSTDLALELVLRGAGAAVVPEDLAEPYRRRGELALVRGPREPLRDAVWLNELRAARRSRAPAAFRELLLERLGRAAGGA
jgi:DNA-binding transcriptional LysR family regulator